MGFGKFITGAALSLGCATSPITAEKPVSAAARQDRQAEILQSLTVINDVSKRSRDGCTDVTEHGTVYEDPTGMTVLGNPMSNGKCTLQEKMTVDMRSPGGDATAAVKRQSLDYQPPGFKDPATQYNRQIVWQPGHVEYIEGSVNGKVVSRGVEAEGTLDNAKHTVFSVRFKIRKNFGGDICTVDVKSTDAKDGTVDILQDEPLPCNLVGGLLDDAADSFEARKKAARAKKIEQFQ